MCHTRRLQVVLALLAGVLVGSCGGDPTTIEPPPKIASVVILPASPTLSGLGDTVTLTARALDANGDTIFLPFPLILTDWSSSDKEAVRVRSLEQDERNLGGGLTRIHNRGLAQAIAGGNGTVTVRAIMAGVSAEVDILAREVVGVRFVAVNAGAFHTCGITTVDRMHCWGNLDPDEVVDDLPLLVHTQISEALTFSSVDVGVFHRCGIGLDGSTYCFGGNSDGQLGDGTQFTRDAPVAVTSGITFETVTTGGRHTCGLTTTGKAYCWGDDSGGKLGDGTTDDSTVPVEVAGGHTYASLSAGGVHTCGVTTNSEVFCWGRNQSGQLGSGTTLPSAVPVRVRTGTSFASVASAGAHTCALTPAGIAHCWGRNANGELGDGTTTDRSHPARVATDLVFASIRSTAAAPTPAR